MPNHEFEEEKPAEESGRSSEHSTAIPDAGDETENADERAALINRDEEHHGTAATPEEGREHLGTQEHLGTDDVQPHSLSTTVSAHDTEPADLETTRSEEPSQKQEDPASGSIAQRPGHEKSTPPATFGEDDQRQIEKQISDAYFPEFKRALDEKNWQAIADLLGLDYVYVEGHPESTSDLVAKLDKATEKLCDFEAIVLRVNKNQVQQRVARFSAKLRIIWNSCENWDDYDVYVDVHIGFARGDGQWRATHLSLNRANLNGSLPKAQPTSASGNATETPRSIMEKEQPHFLPEQHTSSTAGVHKPSATKSTPAPVKHHPADSKPQATEKPLGDDFFRQAAAQYFTTEVPQEKQGEGVRQQPASLSVGGKHHLLYVPVVMHEDLIKKILGKD